MKKYTIDLETYHEMDRNYEGLCLACGAVRGMVEPDAQDYECFDCGEEQVHGVHELLFMDLVEED